MIGLRIAAWPFACARETQKRHLRLWNFGEIFVTFFSGIRGHWHRARSFWRSGHRPSEEEEEEEPDQSAHREQAGDAGEPQSQARDQTGVNGRHEEQHGGEEETAEEEGAAGGGRGGRGGWGRRETRFRQRLNIERTLNCGVVPQCNTKGGPHWLTVCVCVCVCVCVLGGGGGFENGKGSFGVQCYSRAVGLQICPEHVLTFYFCCVCVSGTFFCWIPRYSVDWMSRYSSRCSTRFRIMSESAVVWRKHLKRACWVITFLLTFKCSNMESVQ